MPVMEKEKTTLSADELLEKLHQNQREDSSYRDQVERYLNGTMPSYERFNLGSNPNILKLLESQAESVVLNQSDLKNALSDKNVKTKNHTEGHEIPVSELYKLSEEIRNPIMVLKGSPKNPDSIVMITELKNKDGANIIAPIALDRQNGTVNKITSLYGKDDIARYLQHHESDILAVNIEKAEKLYRDIGFQLPKLDTVLCFDNSIAYSTQNVKYPQENKLEQEQSAERHTTEKLLPFLNAKANNLNAKLEVRAEKIEAQENAIAQREAKIDKLSARADRLADMNLMLKSTVGSLPFVQKLIERNENKINKIRTKQIPRQEERIKEHDNAILQLEKESSVIQHKLDRCLALNDTIRSFTISNNTERRQKFAQAMDNLHSSTLNCMIDKRAELRERAAYLASSYNEMTYAIDKASIASTIRKTNNRIDKLTDKINTLSGVTTPITGRTDAQIDTAMERTSAKISEHMEKGDFSMPAISEAVCEEVFVQPEQQREQDNPLRNAEMAVEENYNSIDGVINNVDTDVPQQSEEHQSVAASQPVAETQKEVEKTKNEAINPEYYKSLQKSERLIINQPKEMAQKIMGNLNEQGVRYSAVPRKNDMIAITVSKIDKTALDSAREAAKQQQCKEFINSDYYKSLPKEERFTQRMSESDARSAVQQLVDNEIEHSAVLDGRKSAVTVSIKDEQKARPFLSNKQRQKEAQKIKQQPKHEKTPEMQHKKKQEIG